MLLFVYRVCQELLDFQLQKKRKGVGVIRALIKVSGITLSRRVQEIHTLLILLSQIRLGLQCETEAVFRSSWLRVWQQPHSESDIIREVL